MGEGGKGRREGVGAGGRRAAGEGGAVELVRRRGGRKPGKEEVTAGCGRRRQIGREVGAVSG